VYRRRSWGCACQSSCADADQPAQLLTAKLWYNAEREDVTLCLSINCDRTQQNSGYTLLSGNEGTVDPSSIPPPGMPGGKGLAVPLFFSWSEANKDNWVTNSSACPGSSYHNCGNPDGVIYCCEEKGRIPLVAYSNANGTHHLAAATARSKAWAIAHGYHAGAVLGYLDSPPPSADLCKPHAGTDYVCCDMKRVNVSNPGECCAACKAAAPACTAWKTSRDGGVCYLKTGTLSNPVKVGADVVVGYSQTPAAHPKRSGSVWSFGVSGDVQGVPAGFRQSTLLVHSHAGANDAWDEWGSSLRSAYDTRKLADEDVFLAALTMWTDSKCHPHRALPIVLCAAHCLPAFYVSPHRELGRHQADNTSRQTARPPSALHGGPGLAPRHLRWAQVPLGRPPTIWVQT
jgi:hypothetical protein